MMQLQIPKQDILAQLIVQLESHFILSNIEKTVISDHLDLTLEKCESNFWASSNKYFKIDVGGHKNVRFNPYHSVQYMIFLYYLSHEIYANTQNSVLCDKIYYLNKIMNSVDLFYAIELPQKFGAEHPLGSVMGRAQYGEGFFFYQGCTVGGTDGKNGEIYYPVLGENVQMYANSSILGRCKVGDNVKIGAGTLVKNEDIPSDSIVFGQSPHLIIKKQKHELEK